MEAYGTSKDIHDYVCSCGYYGTDKAVMMDLKRYADHGMIQREKVDGKYHYRPVATTADLHNYLEEWEDELIEFPTQMEKELMF